MLLRICDQSAISLDGKLITQSSLLPEISEEVIDADLHTLESYFTKGTWIAVLQRGTVCLLLHIFNNSFFSKHDEKTGNAIVVSTEIQKPMAATCLALFRNCETQPEGDWSCIGCRKKHKS